MRPFANSRVTVGQPGTGNSGLPRGIIPPMMCLFRRAFNGAAAVSVLMFVATCVLWRATENDAVSFWGRAKAGAGSAISARDTV